MHQIINSLAFAMRRDRLFRGGMIGLATVITLVIIEQIYDPANIPATIIAINEPADILRNADDILVYIIGMSLGILLLATILYGVSCLVSGFMESWRALWRRDRMALAWMTSSLLLAGVILAAQNTWIAMSIVLLVTGGIEVVLRRRS